MARRVHGAEGGANAVAPVRSSAAGSGRAGAAARPAAARRGQTTRKPPRGGATRSLDLEAIGLVLLALGLAFLAVLVPRFPSGEVGAQLRQAMTQPVGLGVWVLPWPFLVMGGLFLLRRYPGGWPRVVLGYLVGGVGAWSLLMLVAPSLSGEWGMALRSALTGAAGALAYLPALLLLSFGLELVAGWPLTSIARRALAATIRGLRALAKAVWRARNRARARAAFRADVARVRRELLELDRDLAALAGLYPGSAELARWRESVQAAVRSLRSAQAAGLDVARGDAAAWRAAVGDFARDRAQELGHLLRSEGARAPDGSPTLEAWARERKAVLDEPLVATQGAGLKSPAAFEGLRRALSLDLTGLLDRHRRLGRERDLAETGLVEIRPRELWPANQAHAERLQSYRAMEQDAEALDADVQAFDAWRELFDALWRARADFPADTELGEYDTALVDSLKANGREELAKLEGWTTALLRVSANARQRAANERAAAAAAAEALAAERAVEDDLAGSPMGSEEEHAYDSDQGSADAPPWDELMDVELESLELLDDSVQVSAGRAAGTAQRGRAAALPTQDRGGGQHPEGRAGGQNTLPVGGIPIQLPQLELLDPPETGKDDPLAQARELRERVQRIDITLSNFKLEGRVVDSVRGPTVTRFEVEPAAGEKISRFANLSDDLALAMAVASVRIEAPIPGKSVIGLEVPNASRDLVRFREAVESQAFKRSKARLPLILGKSIDGEMLVGDLARMPHLLIAGSTGSGKSVAVNTLIGSLLYRFLPTEMRFLMIDPKMVELTPFDGIKHLIRPVVTNPSEASGVLLGAVSHMERRYKMMSKIGAKNLDQYNAKARNLDLPELPFIVIVIDELADLMITSPKEVESAIMRLAQMARATGMHLILATQRPSVDILTSLIKVNVPARMAFAVSSGFDSRTILDTMGAERLIGMGDMLYHQPGLPKPMRLQNPFVAESEIGAVADFLRRQYFEDEFVEAYGDDFEPASSDDSDATGFVDWNDDKLRIAAEMVINEGQASVSRLQRRLQVGHARAGKLMDSLEALGVVGPHTGSKPREVLVSFEELPNVFGK